MSFTPDARNREGYSKLVNIKQGQPGQFVSVYIPDKSRKRSPEAEARALARSEIKEAYKAAALAEEVKQIKKQRDKLVENLARAGQVPSVLSGTPMSYTPSATTTPAVTTTTTTTSPITKTSSRPFNANVNYSAPIGPVTQSGAKAYDNKINYSAPIGPMKPNSRYTPGGSEIPPPFSPSRNYTAPIGPMPMPLGPSPPFSPSRNYPEPIGPMPMPLGPSPPFSPSRNYPEPIGPMPMPFGPSPSFSPSRNYPEPIGPMPGPNMSPSFSPSRNYPEPIGPVTQSGRRPEPSYSNNNMPIGPPTGPRGRSARLSSQETQQNDEDYNNENVQGPETQSGTRPSRAAQGPATKSGTLPEQPPGKGRLWERAIGQPYKQGMNLIYVVKQLRARKAKSPAKAKSYDAAIADAKTDPRLAITALNLKPEQLLPGKTLAEVEALYKTKRAKAVAKGNMKFVQALDTAVAIRRQQLGGSAKPTPSGFTPTGKTPAPSSAEQNAERLLPGKTEQAVRKIHAERKAAALKKGDKALAARLDKALPIRLQRLKTQGANVMKVSPERLLPGKTIAEVEATYKQRRAAAVQKKRDALVAALDRAIVERRKQLGGSAKPTPSGFTPTGKTPAPSSAEQNAERLLPGKTEDAVKRIYADRKSKALKKGDKALAARLDKALPIRLQRLKTQGANVMKVSPERLLPGKTLEEVEATYKQRRAAAVQKRRTALVTALDRAIAQRRKQFGAHPGKAPSPSPVRSPTGKTPAPSSPERNAEVLLPAKTEQAVRKIHAERKAAALKKGDKALAARLNKALPIRIQRLKAQGANVMKIPPEQLLPGKTLAEVEAAYKQRRDVAVKKQRAALVQALDRAIVTRRKQLGAPGAGGQKFKSAKNVPPEVLIPGKTLQAVEAEYKKRKASAEAKKRTDLVKRLDAAIAVRRKQLAGTSIVPASPGKSIVPASPGKSIVPGKSPAQKKTGKKFGSMKNVPPHVLLPGNTLQAVEAEYNKRKAAALAKKRTDLVDALDRAFAIRKKQFASGKVPQMPGKKKSSSPIGSDWAKVFGPVDMKNPNPRTISEKYQKIRAQTADDDRGKLNALFKKAIQDIKIIKRKQTAQVDKQKQDVDKQKQAVEKKKRSEVKTLKKKIRKATVGAEKATANIQRFQQKIAVATQRRDTSKIVKFRRATEKRTQNLKRARDAREKFIAELKKVETSSPLRLGASPAKTSPLRLGAPPAKVQSPLRLGAPPAKTSPLRLGAPPTKTSPLRLGAPPTKMKSPQVKTPPQKSIEQQKQIEQKKKFDQQRQADQKRILDQQTKQRKQIDDQKRQQAQQAQKRQQQARQSQQKQQSQKRSQQKQSSFRPRTPSPIKRRR